MYEIGRVRTGCLVLVWRGTVSAHLILCKIERTSSFFSGGAKPILPPQIVEPRCDLVLRQDEAAAAAEEDAAAGTRPREHGEPQAVPAAPAVAGRPGGGGGGPPVAVGAGEASLRRVEQLLRKLNPTARLLRASHGRVVRRIRPNCNTKGYSSTYLAMGFANVRAGTWSPPEH